MAMAPPPKGRPAPNDIDSDDSSIRSKRRSPTIRTSSRRSSSAPPPSAISLLLLLLLFTSEAAAAADPLVPPDGRPPMRGASSTLLLRVGRRGKGGGGSRSPFGLQDPARGGRGSRTPSYSYHSGSLPLHTTTRNRLNRLPPPRPLAAFVRPELSRAARASAAAAFTSRPTHPLPASAIPDSPTTTAATNTAAPSSSSSSSPSSYPSTFPPLPDMADPNHTPYEKLIRRLYMTNLFHPVKLGLDNIERLHDALGSPMDNPDITIIHIAGTNGKGSVALKIANSLQLAGNSVGLFTSPHVSSFRERMSINSTLISESEVEDRLPRVFEACELNSIPATFFEVTTALAFLHFAEGGANVVVLETGLGGRLDATNIVREPAISVITSIGLEHTRILGDTVEEIALEKGGIIKEGRPVLVGPNVPHEVLRQCATEKGADGYFTVEDVLGGSEEDGSTTTTDGEGQEDYVDYDAENSRIATAALRLLSRQDRPNLRPVTDEHIRRGIAVRPPCRFEQVELMPPGKSESVQPVSVVLDVAHNPDAMHHLVIKLERTYPARPKRIVCGFSADKDLKQCGASLLSIVTDESCLHLVEASHPRAARLEDMLEAEPRLRSANFDDADRSITAQVTSALRLASDREEVLVICGSVFLMAEAREALGYDEPRDSDYIAEVAGANLKHGQENFGNSDPEERVSSNAK